MEESGISATTTSIITITGETSANASTGGGETEPEAKKRKISREAETTSQGQGQDKTQGHNTDKDKYLKLEHRLGGILCCTVCLDLPPGAVFQCTNGHLMCAGCFTHILADARLRDETATCPNCRVEISKDSASRNLAVENAISELPSECKYCSKEFARNSLDHHQETLCEERTTGCKYKCIGCPWRGPQHEAVAHEERCVHPKRTGAEVMASLQANEKVRLQDELLYNTLFELLSYEKITFNDLQFKPYRTAEYVNRLFYETSRFSAFNHQWVVKAHINNSQNDPTQCTERDITYQVILKSKTTNPLCLHYVVLRGPFGDMKTMPRIYQYEFNEKDAESTASVLPLPDSNECNRLLSNKAINFRLIMFLATK